MSRRALILVFLAACAAGPLAARASAADLWVGGARAGCSDALAASAVTTPALTWCTLGQAANDAAAGDTVHVLAADYRETVRFYTSGTQAAPIHFVAAEPGVVVDAAGAGQALKLMDVSDVEISGLRVTGASAQGIWVQGGARVRLVDLDVAANPGAGLSIKGTANLSLEASAITGNGSAGVLELAGTRDARYADNEIRGNGIGAATYNGDGIQLGGTGAHVLGNTIAANGSSTFEHGIYTGAASSGWTIELNNRRSPRTTRARASNVGPAPS